MAGDASRRNGAKGGRPRKTGAPATAAGKRLETAGAAAALTPKQATFVVCYCGVSRFNGTDAYKRAFGVVEDRKGGTRAARLLKLPHVRAAVLDSLGAQAEALGVMDGEEAMLGISRLARFDVGRAFTVDGRLLPIGQMPFDVRDCVTSIKVATKRDPAGKDPTDVLFVTEIRTEGKLKSRELLAKAAGRLKDTISLEAGKGLVELLAEIEGVKR